MRHGLPEIDEITGRHLDWRLLRRFLDSVRPYRGAAWASLLLLPLSAAAKLVQPWLLMVAIDRYILPGDLAGLPGARPLPARPVRRERCSFSRATWCRRWAADHG
jgi:ATP-binding cassette subfamily B protein